MMSPKFCNEGTGGSGFQKQLAFESGTDVITLAHLETDALSLRRLAKR